MRLTVVVVAFAAQVVVVPSSSSAQAGDSPMIGQRVRVQVAASRRNTGVFIGNLAAITPETRTHASRAVAAVYSWLDR